MKPWALLLLLGVAAGLAGYSLPYRGLIYADEYTYFYHVCWLEQQVPQVPRTPLNLLGDSVEYTAKPMFLFLLRIVYGLTHGYAASPLLLSASMMVVTVFLTFRLGQRFFGSWGGWWAALLLALSPYALLYARSGFAQMTATAFLMTGLWRYFQGRAPAEVGLWMGTAFCTHYSTGIVAIGIVLVELTNGLTGTPWRTVLLRGVRFCAGCAAIPLVFQGAWWLDQQLDPAGWSNTGLLEYLIRDFKIAAGIGNPWWGAYGFYLWQLQGIIFCAALVVTMIALGKVSITPRQESWPRQLLVLTLLPLAWWTIGPPNGQMMRTMAVVLPLLCLTVMGGIVKMTAAIRRPVAQALAATFVMSIGLTNVPRIVQIVNWRSEFTQFLKANQAHPVKSVLITSQIGTWGLLQPALLPTGYPRYPEARGTIFYHCEVEEHAIALQKQVHMTHCLVGEPNVGRFSALLRNAVRVGRYTNVESQFPLGALEGNYNRSDWQWYVRLALGKIRREHIPDWYLYEFPPPE